MREYKIAAIPGDGIGVEVIAAGVETLKTLARRDGGFELQFEDFAWGGDYYKKHGRMMAADGLDTSRAFDAIYFGAVGAPDLPDDITLWGLRLAICQGFDQYANVRPSRVLPGISPLRKMSKPSDLDWVIVRENSEGEYAGHGGRAHAAIRRRSAPKRRSSRASASLASCASRSELARRRPRKLLTLITKSNAQKHGMVMWDEILLRRSRRTTPTSRPTRCWWMPRRCAWS